MNDAKANGNAEQPQPGVQAEIIIRLMTNGQVMVNGPLNNKMLIYGLLECARDAVLELSLTQDQPLITPVILKPKFGN